MTMRLHAVLLRRGSRPPSVVRVLTRALAVAVRIDRTVATRVLLPMHRLDRAAGARLAPLATGLAVLLLRLVRAAVLRPADRLAALVADWLLPPSATTADAERPPAGSRLGTSRRPVAWGAPVREIALCSGLVLLVGLAAVGVRGPETERAVAAGAVSGPSSAFDRPVPRPAPFAEPGTAQAEARIGVDLVPPRPTAPAPSRPPAPAPAPAPAAAPAPAPAPPPAARWLPTGTGVWLHDWAKTEGGNPADVVARVKGLGISHLYVQTGSSKKGFIGGPALDALLPAVDGTGIELIAWDFPKLVEPETDARRLAHAILWHVEGAGRVAAVAPDIETPAEGTRLSADAVVRYYRTLREVLPPHVAILATVPWPSEKRVGSYPYAETAAYSDAFVPMAYWYNRPPDVVTATSMQWLAQFGLPVMPAGQGYNGRVDAPYLPEDPDPRASMQRFVDAARAHRARSISLWSWQTVYPQAWEVLAGASRQPWPAAP